MDRTEELLRPVRGVHKGYLHGYGAVFEWALNLREVTPAALRRILRPLQDLKLSTSFVSLADRILSDT